MKPKPARRYVKRLRAESESETRDRILEAVMEIHQEVGPARTTISAVAERAGVQRLTVYRHFPEEKDMIAACAGRWGVLMPFPELAAFEGLDPRNRARETLLALYRYYRSGERMLSWVIHDAREMPDVHRGISPLFDYVRSVVCELERCWPKRSAARLRPTLEHAVQFSTWKSLSAITGSDSEAADLVMRWCASA